MRLNHHTGLRRVDEVYAARNLCVCDIRLMMLEDGEGLFSPPSTKVRGRRRSRWPSRLECVHAIQRLHHHPVCFFMGFASGWIHVHDAAGVRSFRRHRLVVAAASWPCLCWPFSRALPNGEALLQDGRVQLATASHGSLFVVLLLLVWQLNLAEWWWTVYGTVFGSVPLMYIALDHLAKCTSQGLSQAWPIERVVPVEALGGAGGFNLLGG